MKRSHILLNLMFCVYLFEVAYASEEEQFVCELRTEVVVTNHLASVPSAKVRAIAEKYVFIVNGSKGTFINLNYPDIKGPLAVHSDGLKVSFVEQNTSDNLFVATIFRSAKGGLHEIIFSFHSESQEIDQYYPKQLFGTCH